MKAFESNVIYIGTKTKQRAGKSTLLFESNVIYIGTKTDMEIITQFLSLRVM